MQKPKILLIMKKIYLPILVLVAFFVASCTEKAEDFENIVEITPMDAQSFDLPEVHFMFSYPTDDNISIRLAKANQNNYSYAYIDYMDGDYIQEEISIGYCNNCYNSETSIIEDLLTNISAEFEYQLTDYNVVSSGYQMFDGEQRSVLNFTFTISDNALGFVEGEYIGVFVVYLSDKTENGILFGFLANKNETDIKDFDDFTKKGDLVDIFRTFRLVD